MFQRTENYQLVSFVKLKAVNIHIYTAYLVSFIWHQYALSAVKTPRSHQALESGEIRPFLYTFIQREKLVEIVFE